MSALQLPLPSGVRTHEFPITSEYTYLNAATEGPLLTRTRHALEAAMVQAQFPGTPRARVEPPMVDAARGHLAQLLHVDAHAVAFTPNTTYGLNICAQGIDWRAGDNVVVPAHEFPSVLYTWLHLRTLGVEVRCVPWHGDGPDVDTVMAAVDSRTRVVSCSAVAWDTGYRIDLEALGQRCAQAGCLLIIDGIQAVGAVDLDLRALHISALSLHGYKWLMAGFGVGALYVAPHALDQIQPRFVGEQSYVTNDDPQHDAPAWQPGARRYTVGGANAFGLTALATSLAWLSGIGMPAIERYDQALGQMLIDGLLRLAPTVRLISPRDAARRAAIVVFTLGDSARDEQLVQRLSEHGILVALRRRGVRVSPHLYNNGTEIEHLLHCLPPIIASLS